MTTCEPMKRRVVAVNKYKDACLGACIYLSANDLRQLGVEIDNTESIQYDINQSGNVVITEPKK